MLYMRLESKLGECLEVEGTTEAGTNAAAEVDLRAETVGNIAPFEAWG